MANDKTNAMRILDSSKISYGIFTYDTKGDIDGISVAHKIGKPMEQVYKTLVTQGASKNYFVFVIPVDHELNLKAAARAVGEKSIEMIKVADITKVTGYVRGGCSPIGMKKPFKTVIHDSCNSLKKIIVSAGKIGFQVEIAPEDLIAMTGATIENIC